MTSRFHKANSRKVSSSPHQRASCPQHLSSLLITGSIPIRFSKVSTLRALSKGEIFK